MTGLSFTDWTDKIAAAAAILAIIISIFSLKYSRESLTLAKNQDRRKHPKLSAKFIGGNYCLDTSTGIRSYNIQISISNQSDSDNAVTRAELYVKYRLHGDTEMTVRLPQSDGTGQLELPMRISAHDTASGWCRFSMAPEIFSRNRIERYMVELTDTHNGLVSVEPLLLSRQHDDTQI
jgi:hypothetical protein